MIKMLLLSAAMTLTGMQISNGQYDMLPPPPQTMITAAQNSFHEYDTGNTFDKLLSSGTDLPLEMQLVQTYDPASHASLARSSQIYPHEHFEDLARRSDFTVVGVPLKRWSFPTEGNHFAVSIYLVRITELTATWGGLPIGQEIYIARAGGPVDYKGHVIRALDSDFPLFRLDDEYIFFGKAIGKNIYKVNSETSLHVQEGLVRESSSHEKHHDLFFGRTKESILKEAVDGAKMRDDHDRMREVKR